jgi:putative ABC transport system permease protein
MLHGLLRNLFRRDRVERDLDQEVRAYRDMLADEKVQHGMTQKDAERAARIELGGIEQVKEQVRAGRAGAWLDALAADLRYAFRTLRRNPGFAAVAVITLALGIGANTALFSAVNALLLRALPYKEADRLVYVTEFWPHEPYAPGPPSPDFINWRANARAIEDIQAYGGGGAVTLTTGADAARIPGTMVTAGLLDMIGVRPALGRNFTPAEDLPGAPPVAILGYSVWQRRFGGSSDVIGKQIELDGVGREVVGVLPASFVFPDNNFGQELLLPMGLDPNPGWRERSLRLLRVIARAKAGVTPEALHAEFLDLLRHTASEEPPQFVTMRKDMEVRVIPLRQWLAGDVRPALLVLQAAVAMVLLIGCLNVANLQIARGISRRKEMALRTALGAGRARITRQLLTEGLLLGSLGGVVGLALGYWALNLMRSFLPASLHLADTIRIDPRVLAFTLAIAVASGVMSGLAPVLAATRTRLDEALKEGSSRTTEPGSHHHLHRVLVIAEVAIAMVLLAGSGLLIRSFVRMASLNPGFDPGISPESVLTLRIALPARKYATDQSRTGFYSQLVERATALPGVQNAAIGGGLPLIGTLTRVGTWFEGRAAPPPGGRPSISLAGVSSGYFQALRIPLRQGRAFNDADGEDTSRVVIVNQAFADQFFPGQDAIGKNITFAAGNDLNEIVGIAGNVRQQGLRTEASPTMYVPYRQSQFPETEMLLILRSGLPPAGLSAAAVSAVRSIDPDVPVYDVATMRDRLAEALSTQRANTALMGVFAAVALLLAAIGIFGVIAYMVSRRSLEIGIRMALGAQHQDVMKMVLGHGMILALRGITIGLIGALAATRALRSLLFETSPSDPWTLTAAAGLFAGVAAAACYIPARRAVSVDPMTTLRHD